MNNAWESQKYLITLVFTLLLIFLPQMPPLSTNFHHFPPFVSMSGSLAMRKTREKSREINRNCCCKWWWQNRGKFKVFCSQLAGRFPAFFIWPIITTFTNTITNMQPTSSEHLPMSCSFPFIFPASAAAAWFLSVVNSYLSFDGAPAAPDFPLVSLVPSPWYIASHLINYAKNDVDVDSDDVS